MSKINVNTWEPETGTTITAGASGDTLAISADSVTGLNVGSDAAGDVLYHDGTDYTRLAKPGTPADEVLTFATGASAPSWVAAASGGGIAGVQVYDSSSSPYTWTKSTRESATGKTINRILVEVQASGGGGGSTVSGWGGGGGGAGGYAMKLLDVTGIDTCTATVGASVAAATGGAASSFAHASGGVAFTTVSCTGGAKGANGENPGYGNGGTGGSGSDGDLNIEGMNGNEGLGNAQMGGASRFSGAKFTNTGAAMNANANNYGHGGYGASTSGGGLIVVWEIN